MEECLRVLQYVRVLDNGGIESLIFNLLDKFDRDIVNFDFLLTRNKDESYEDSLKKYGCHKIVVTSKYSKFIPLRFYRSYKSLNKYFRSCPYKIIHFQSVGTSFGGSLALLAAKKAGIPVRIVHAHSAYSKTNFIRRINIFLGQYLHRCWGTHFMACSKKAAEFSFGKNYKSKCDVYYLRNGIDTNKFAFDNYMRRTIRDEFGLQNKFVLGSIGRIAPPKNHMFMVDILESFLKIRDDAILLIVGGLSTSHEAYYDLVKLYVQQKGLSDKVVFVGERQDAYKIYNAIDAYLFPSLWEGLGIAAIEAQTNGLHVFASNHVPEETNLTSHIHYLSLELGAEEWVKKIASYEYKDCRSDSCDEVKRGGYDIRDSAEKLQSIYIKLYEEFVKGETSAQTK